MWRSKAAAIAAATLLAACTTDGVNTVTNRGLDYRPVVDMKAVDRVAYQRDLAECKQYAAKVDSGGSALAGALLGGLGGAAVGAATGAVYGQAGTGAAAGATLGGTSGVVGGAVSAQQAQETIIRRCLAGRGYTVLY